MLKLLQPLCSSALILAILLASCAGRNVVRLDIPAGSATQTLKDFARQANVEIVFDARSVSGVRTNAVHGEYDPLSALRHMLKDTSLKIDFDRETGAYAVIRI